MYNAKLDQKLTQIRHEIFSKIQLFVMHHIFLGCVLLFGGVFFLFP